MRLLYKMFFQFYYLGIHIASFFSEKARLWTAGRKDLLLDMQKAVIEEGRNGKERPVIWFHCASLGEFEQGRPVLERFRQEYPGWRILLTFFSPSGYEVRKNYSGADHIFYLPPDTTSHVRQFLDIWKPQMAVFVKYEYWFTYINELHKRQIPMVVISAIFRKQQYFFQYRGAWFRQQLRLIKWFFVQDEASAALLKAYGFKGVIVSGDTRFDRVWRLRQSSETFPEVAAFVGDDPVLIAGSTWPKDEQALKPLMKDKSLSMKFIIAPHEVNEERLKHIEALVGEESVRLSSLSALKSGKGINQPAPKVLIIDSIGKLSHLYQYGNIALIGGGFGRGIHNILEAATFGLPVFFGPNYQKFAEARELISRGGAFKFETADQLKQQVQACLADKQRLQKCTDICLKYVESKKGATDVIIQHLGQWLN
jgi:3-deoxy-D-manno-octulosonic-acid transferase